MAELIVHNKLLPLLSNITICKLSDKNLYDEVLLNKYLYDIVECLDRKDIASINLIQSELYHNNKKYSDAFLKRFSLLNEMHFNLKEIVKNELMSHYSKNEDADKSIQFYQNIEKDILNNLNKVFQEDVYSYEKNISTYNILLSTINEVIYQLKFETVDIAYW